MTTELFVGLMSGTSLDGIDAVVAQPDAEDPLVAAHFQPFPERLREELKSLQQTGGNELHRSALAANALSGEYADAVQRVLAQAGVARERVRAIGCHGQTVRHDPAHGYTIQLLSPARLAELTSLTVVCDFRSRDIAAGGQGAPLAPAYHKAVFAHAERTRAVVNLGGIANVSYLPRQDEVIGFDCGPANGLLDEWIAECKGLAYDAGGAWAAQGKLLQPLLDALLADPYFAHPPPKSTGRDVFNLKWARAHIRADANPADVQATFAELTARSLAGAIDRYCPRTEEVFLCGGGASNEHLVGRIRAALPRSTVATTAALGIHPDWVEALAFAWLAREALAGRPGNLPSVTGAAGLRILGAIYPA
jgi:anhydro-N-acetylmuramic acid kinase